MKLSSKFSVYLLVISLVFPKSWAGGDSPEGCGLATSDGHGGWHTDSHWGHCYGSQEASGSSDGHNTNGSNSAADLRGSNGGRGHERYKEFLDPGQNLIPTVYENGYVKKQMARLDPYGQPLKPTTPQEFEEYQKIIGNMPRRGAATMGEVEKSLTAFYDWLYRKREEEKREIDRVRISEEQRKWREEYQKNWDIEYAAILKRKKAEAKAPYAAIEQNVKELSDQARQKLSLPFVSAQLEQEASLYIQTQLTEAENLATVATNGAGEGLSTQNAKIIADFAVDSATSINLFLGGLTTEFARQFYQTALSTTQVAAAIYQNPKIIANLSNNLMVTLTSKEFLKSIREDIQNCKDRMTSGTAYEKGEAVGEVSAFIVMGLAWVEMNAAGKVALESIGEKVLLNDAAEELTHTFLSRAKTSDVLVEEITALERATTTTFEILEVPAEQGTRKYGPFQPGRLHKIKEGTGVVADTFRSGSYSTRNLEEPIRLFRVQSHAPNPEFPLSHYWTKSRPTGPIQAKIDSALARRFRNDGSNWIEIEVPAGQTIHEGFSVSINSNDLNLLEGATEVLQGGGSQVYLEGEIPHSWIKDSGRFYEKS